MLSKLSTLSGELKLPGFFPDATRGYIKGVSSENLKKCNVSGVVVNTYHLLKEGLIEKIEKKGIHNYMRLNLPIISDSGGFQVMSLIHRHPELGKIEKDKIIFNLDNKKIVFTPEKCISLQFKIGADIIMCLDDCTNSSASLKEQKISVERTICWAQRCKKEFERLTKNMKKKPLLFAIVQGGTNKPLRKKCAQELIKIGFDGYAFGGWPVKKGKLLVNILKYTANLLPNDKIKYCMGVGKPCDIIQCVKMGYNLFDCVIPTRNARHKSLFVFKNNKLNSFVLNIKGKNKSSNKKISSNCQCELCKDYKISELYTLFSNRNPDSIRLATIHNLTFYSELMKRLDKD